MDCMCGCGQKTKVATRTDNRRGVRKGEYNKFLNRHHMNGKHNPRWSRDGVEFVDINGYVEVTYKSHIHANSNGKVKKHRLVMEEHLGRVLDPREVVHHINEDIIDNRIENLYLCANKSEHMKIHWEIWKGGDGDTRRARSDAFRI